MTPDSNASNEPLPSGPRYLPLPPRLGVSPSVVVLICLLLGLALGWGWGGERNASWLANSLDVTKTNLTHVRSNQSELAALLADDRTRVIPLQSRGSTATATAVLVWNQAQGRAMLMCQELWPLSSGGKYQLKARGSGGMTDLAVFTPSSAGVTAIQFRIPSGETYKEFELFVASKEGASHPLFAGTLS